MGLQLLHVLTPINYGQYYIFRMHPVHHNITETRRYCINVLAHWSTIKTTSLMKIN